MDVRRNVSIHRPGVNSTIEIDGIEKKPSRNKVPK